MGMQDFSFFFRIGWEHIISWDALDHLLFIMALAVIFQWEQWRQVLILITAFTVGHFITLWLTVAGYLEFTQQWVELLIPITIVLTATSNLMKKGEKQAVKIHYAMALGFGLIHGMGYANAIRFGLTEGQSIGWSLFGFNIGLELGQILVVAIVLVLSTIISNSGLRHQIWVKSISLMIIGLALKMVWERLPIPSL